MGDNAMERFRSADEVLDFAIARELQAAQFYEMLAGRVPTPAMKQVFVDFAKEEMGHKAKIEAIKKGKMGLPTPQQITDLKIAEIVDDKEVTADISYQDALILAMKREKAAFKFYNDLAAMVSDEGLRNVFLALAQEEAKHKLRFELEYEEAFMGEN
jgi:rubrerythrin